MNFWILLATIILFGILGGYVNALRSNQEIKDVWKSLVKGVVAALLVPVFLEIIKSELGKEFIDWYDYLIFGGLCLISAIFSDRFIDTLGQKILNKAESAERTAAESEKKVNTVIENNAEPEEGEESVEKKVLSFDEFNQSQSKQNVQRIINSLEHEKYKYRTLSGITKDTGLSKPVVKKMLNDLQKKGFVTSIYSGKRTLWTLNR